VTASDGLPLRVTTAEQAAARDHSAIAHGVPSFSLMLDAGTATAAVILRDYHDRLSRGVVVYAGVGNNGGDAYVVAAQLARAGVRVRLVGAGAPRTADAQRAAEIAERYVGGRITSETSQGDGSHGDGSHGEASDGDERLVVDGLLGTGHRGPLREPMTRLCAALAAHRARGAIMLALDVPSGLDATTGERAAGSVAAHVTVTYGTIKRGLLAARAQTGRLLLLDIGLGTHAGIDDEAWHLANARVLAHRLPAIAWDAHKGRRGHLALVGGATGMAGAIVLATRAALQSGIGLARGFVEGDGVSALQRAVPQAIAGPWTLPEEMPRADALAIGPGLGRSESSRHILRATLDAWPLAPVLLDADALTLIATGTADAARQLRTWCGATRAIVCTPHPGEFARLIGRDPGHDWQSRDEALRDFADRANATVLLKGTPTLIATPAPGAPYDRHERARIVAMPRGAAVLATGGSGDLLTGIIGALLAQGLPAADAALIGATAHGLAAERVAARGVRGATLDDVLRALPMAWRDIAQPPALPPAVLLELPAPAGVA